MAEGPLSRFKVLELTVARAGPVAARQLADWGADVVKIEVPEEMEEPALRAKSFRHAGDFQNINRNRRAITLNLKHPKGIATLLRLADQADVLIENFRPSVKDRLGFGYDTLAKRNPRLVYASLSGFGQDGPYADRPGVDQILQGMAGMMSITGQPDGPPTRVGVAIVDFCTGLLTAIAVLTALHEREVSGRGQWVQTSLLQTEIFLLDFQAARWLQEKEVPGPAGNDHPTFRPTGLFRARDGLINIAPGPQMWPRFCAAIGLEAIQDDPRFSTIEARYQNSAALTAAIEEVTGKEDVAPLVERLNKAGIPAGPINRIDQVFADRQVQHLGIVQPVVSEELGVLRQVRQPMDFSRTPQRAGTGAPERGRHNAEVLADFGFSQAEIAELTLEQAI